MFFVEISVDDLPLRMFVSRQFGNRFDFLGNLWSQIELKYPMLTTLSSFKCAFLASKHTFLALKHPFLTFKHPF